MRQIPHVTAAIIIGLLITWTGLTLWTVAFTLFKPLIAVGLMSVILWFYCKYLSSRFRKTRLSAPQWKLGLLAGLAIVFVLEAGIVLTFRLIPFPDRAFTAEYGWIGEMPSLQAWALVLMGSLVAGICEETGFRGYLQVSLEKRWGRTPAIVVTSVVFTVIHLGKAWSWYIIPLIFFTSVLLGLLASAMNSLIPCIVAHTLFDIVNFSYWWSHLAGRFRMPTIFVNGPDLSFVVTVLVFGGACVLFFRAIKKADR